MQAIELEIPAEVASQIRVPLGHAQQFLMQELVLRLYQEGIITSGQGASLLHRSRLAFEHFLAEHHVAQHCNEMELEQDVQSLEGAL